MYYATFEDLCRQRKVKPADVSRATGIATATLTSWKKGTYTPKPDKLQKIAEYFNVSLEYLMTGKDSEKVSSDGTSWYFSDDTARLAQEIHDKPHLHALLDAERDLSPDAARALKDFIYAQYKREGGGTYAE